MRICVCVCMKAKCVPVCVHCCACLQVFMQFIFVVNLSASLTFYYHTCRRSYTPPPLRFRTFNALDSHSQPSLALPLTHVHMHTFMYVYCVLILVIVVVGRGLTRCFCWPCCSSLPLTALRLPSF